MKDLYRNIILLSVLVGMLVLFYATPHNNEVEVPRYMGSSLPVFVPNYSVMFNIQDLMIDNTSTNVTNMSGDK